MKRAFPFLAPLALFPVLGLGLWLWSDQGAYISGQTLHINGGERAY